MLVYRNVFCHEGENQWQQNKTLVCFHNLCEPTGSLNWKFEVANRLPRLETANWGPHFEIANRKPWFELAQNKSLFIWAERRFSYQTAKRSPEQPVECLSVHCHSIGSYEPIESLDFKQHVGSLDLKESIGCLILHWSIRSFVLKQPIGCLDSLIWANRNKPDLK